MKNWLTQNFEHPLKTEKYHITKIVKPYPIIKVILFFILFSLIFDASLGFRFSYFVPAIITALIAVLFRFKHNIKQLLLIALIGGANFFIYSILIATNLNLAWVAGVVGAIEAIICGLIVFPKNNNLRQDNSVALLSGQQSKSRFIIIFTLLTSWLIALLQGIIGFYDIYSQSEPVLVNIRNLFTFTITSPVLTMPIYFIPTFITACIIRIFDFSRHWLSLIATGFICAIFCYFYINFIFPNSKMDYIYSTVIAGLVMSIITTAVLPPPRNSTTIPIPKRSSKK